jgi:catechol 2,3-dioxygenase-like lactoylglutathione lyase family enzyme
MSIKRASAFVDDQENALRFYTEILGFRKKMDLPAGAFRWLTAYQQGQ